MVMGRVKSLSWLSIGLIVALLSLASGADTRAEPAFWTVRGKDATVYILGTVHALPAGVAWRSDRIDTALRASDDLWLEGQTDITPSETQRIMSLYGTPSGPPLSSRLAPTTLSELTAHLQTLGVSAKAIDRMRPWVAASVLSNALVREAGWDTSNGVDVSLRAQAGVMGKPVRGLESLEAQARIFGEMSPQLELQFLELTLEGARGGKSRLEAVSRAWIDGDLDAQLELTNKPMMARSSELYGRLVSNRNADWADQIDAMLRKPGVHFVAVGGGHLLGDSGLSALLKLRGWSVKRE